MFESPAADSAEDELSLDVLVNLRQPSVFLMRAGTNALSERGIFENSVLSVNRDRSPNSGCVVVAVLSEGFIVREWQTMPPALVSPRCDVPDTPIGDEGIEIWGVVTHCLSQLD